MWRVSRFFVSERNVVRECRLRRPLALSRFHLFNSLIKITQQIGQDVGPFQECHDFFVSVAGLCQRNDVRLPPVLPPAPQNHWLN
ncbi:hypothetical protein, partial [Ferrovum sp.]|uniref:hypothetical protein n=1 Tax=Ferrovum sp. TaxID=2609467 RepID=UPI00262D5C1F